MGVDLTLWSLDINSKSYIKHPMERTSSFWKEIKALPSLKIPDDFNDYEAYELYDSNLLKKKGPGKRKPKTDQHITKKRSGKKELEKDGYGLDLAAVKAIYLKILILDNSIRFHNHFEKEIFLNLDDNANVILYWH